MAIVQRMRALLEDFEDQTYSYKKGPKFSVPKLIAWAEKHGALTEIPLAKLLHNLDTMSADEPIGSRSFRARAMKTELLPILVLERNGKFHIADGLHRLWKAKELGHKTIQGYVVPMNRIPENARTGA